MRGETRLLAKGHKGAVLFPGCTGLEELLSIDPAFEQFEAPLFSQLAKTLARSVQTKAVNKQLDENISLFLTHLSPYFLLKPAHKCLEWLIHRYEAELQK